MLGYVYKATFPNGKVYVGVTNNFNRRITDHKKLAKAGSKQAVHCAIRKYGMPKFEQVVVCFNVNSAYELEPKVIKDLESLAPNGYNVCKGGIGNTNRVGYNKVKVKDQNGKLYSSIREAAKCINKRPQDVWKVLKNYQGRTQIAGYVFTYVCE